MTSRIFVTFFTNKTLLHSNRIKLKTKKKRRRKLFVVLTRTFFVAFKLTSFSLETRKKTRQTCAALSEVTICFQILFFVWKSSFTDWRSQVLRKVMWLPCLLFCVSDEYPGSVNPKRNVFTSIKKQTRQVQKRIEGCNGAQVLGKRCFFAPWPNFVFFSWEKHVE